MRNELINYTTYISKLIIISNVILSKKLEIICTAAKKDLYYFRQWSVLDKIDILKCVLRF